MTKMAFFVEEKPFHFFLRGEMTQFNRDYRFYHILSMQGEKQGSVSPSRYVSIDCDSIEYNRQEEYKNGIKFETFNIMCIPYFTCKVTMPYYKEFNIKADDCYFYIKDKNGKCFSIMYSQNFVANLYMGLASYYNFDKYVFRGGIYVPNKMDVNYISWDYATNAKIWVTFKTEYLLNNITKFSNEEISSFLKLCFCYNSSGHFEGNAYSILYDVIKNVGFGNIPCETRIFLKKRLLKGIDRVIEYNDISKSQKTHLTKRVKKIGKLDFRNDKTSESELLFALNLIMQLPDRKYKNNYKSIISKILYYE